MHPHLLQGSDAAEGQGRREDSAGARSETFPAGQREQEPSRHETVWEMCRMW